MKKINLFLTLILTAFLFLLTYQYGRLADIEANTKKATQAEILERYMQIFNPLTDGELCEMENIIFGKCDL